MNIYGPHGLLPLNTEMDTFWMAAIFLQVQVGASVLYL